MKKLIVVLLFCGLGWSASAQVFYPDPKSSTIEFQIRNLGVTVTGKFGGLTGSIQLSGEKLETARIDLAVPASAIDTGIALRNKHLRGENYFDVEVFPELRITSTAITRNSDGTLRFTGRLLIKGVSGNLTFPFTASLAPLGYEFRGQFKINRLDYLVGGPSLTMSDDVMVRFTIVVRQPSGVVN